MSPAIRAASQLHAVVRRHSGSTTALYLCSRAFHRAPPLGRIGRPV